MSANPETPFPSLRDDLSIQEKDSGDQGKAFSIYDPLAGERFEFDERTFFLCESFDGRTPADQIIERFNERFGSALTLDDLFQVFDELAALGLLAGTDTASVVAFRGEDTIPPRSLTGYETPEIRERDDDEAGANAKEYRWPLFDPSPGFRVLSRAVRPLRLLFLLSVYSLVVMLPVALFMFFDNRLAMSEDLALLGESRSYLGRLVFSLFAVNLLRCVIQGTVITWFHGRVKAFGIRLRFGIIPRFFIDKSAIRTFERHAKLWSYGSNLLFRMVLIVLSVFTWYFAHGTGSQLAIYAIIMAHAAMIGLILVTLPLRASDGYRWMVTYFRLPPSLIKMAVMTFVSTLTGKALPTSVSPTFRRRLLIYGTALILFWTYAFFRITSHIAAGLADSFPLLFGEATEVIIATVVVLLVVRWAVTKFGRLQGSHRGRPTVAGARSSLPTPAERDNFGLIPSPGTPALKAAESPWVGWAVRSLAFGIVVLVLILPHPFRPGGAVTLLPPEQRVIQAPVSGKVTEVLQNGGDGRLLREGTVVAAMSSTALEAQINTLQEQVSEQKALLDKQRAVLDQLLAGARKEEIDQARALAERADHEVTLAERQLETAKLTWRYSAQELERIRELPTGVISALDVSRSEKQAEVDRMRIAEHESNLAVKKKSAEEAKAAMALLLNGASQEEIEVARQDVAAAEAELRRVKGELEHARSQASSGRLTMPFDGYLVDSYLNTKMGSYLSAGETYATVQAHREPMVELLLPEYEVGEMKIGSEAEVRLASFPSDPFAGYVISIEPSGATAAIGQVFKVVIQLNDIEYPVKPGMTGYAKVLVGEKPLFIIVARPIVRFFQIEAWSWIP